MTPPLRRPHPLDTPANGIQRQLTGDLAAGTDCGEGGTKGELVAIAGQVRGRIRAKLSAGTGTLKAKFVYPDEHGEYTSSQVHTTGNPTDVTLGDTNEYAMEFDADDLKGEAYLLVQVVDAGNSGATAVIDRVHVSFLPQ